VLPGEKAAAAAAAGWDALLLVNRHVSGAEGDSATAARAATPRGCGW
jgi:hypothetical protein